jgi:hypothetical protein
MITDTTQSQPTVEITSQPTVEITYEVAEYQEEDKNVEVTYTRSSDGYIYKRMVNIPHNLDGTIDEQYFEDILHGQLSGVINKYKAGVVEFRDPTEVPETTEPVGIAST